jgi:hypothetical protein
MKRHVGPALGNREKAGGAMLNWVLLLVEVVLMAACFSLTLAIRQERIGADHSTPWWLDTKWRSVRGPLTQRGRLFWWLRALCIALCYTAFLVLRHAG